jgi:hypothetical protein
MRISSIVGLGLVILTTTPGVTGSATANTYNFEFSDADGDVAGSGTFTTGPGPSPYTVTGISGSAIDTSFDALPTAITTGVYTGVGTDNLLFFPVPPEAAYVDNLGISFNTADGNLFNIFYVEGYAVVTRVVTGADVDFSVTQVVPEPSTWAMMALGMAGLGFLSSRGKKCLTAPASA